MRKLAHVSFRDHSIGLLYGEEAWCTAPLGVLEPQPTGEILEWAEKLDGVFKWVEVDDEVEEDTGELPAFVDVPSEETLKEMSKSDLVELADSLGIDTDSDGSASDGSMLKKEVLAAILEMVEAADESS